MTSIGVSVTLVTLVFWPMAGYTWTLYVVTPYNPVTGANPVYVSAPVGDLTAPVAKYTWRVSFALTEAVLGSFGAIILFILLGRWLATHGRHETVCRRCGRILCRLSEPKCPACGEPL